MSPSKPRWMSIYKALPRWDFDGFYLVLIMFNNNIKCWLPTLSVNCTFIFLRLVYSLHVWIACSQPLNIWPMKLCVWSVYTCKYMHMCVSRCTCTQVEARGQHWLSSPIALHLIFWDRISHEPWSWLIWRDWQWMNSSGLPVSSTGVTECHHTQLWTWVLGIQTQPLTLAWQAFYWWSHLPSPSNEDLIISFQF